MIAVYCDEMNKRVMLGLGSVTGVVGDNGRLTVSYQCVCGRRGQMLTGRDRRGGGMSGHVVV